MSLTLYDIVTSNKFEFTSVLTKVRESICKIVSDVIRDDLSAAIKSRINSVSASLSTRIKKIKKGRDAFISLEVDWLKERILLNETEIKVRYYY